MSDIVVGIILSSLILGLHGRFGNHPDWHVNGLSVVQILALNDPQRLIMSTLSHVDWIHAGVNVASFLSLSQQLEGHFGSIDYLVLIALLALDGSILTMYLQRKLDTTNIGLVDHNSNARIKGFSGVLFGLLTIAAGFRQSFCVYSWCFQTYHLRIPTPWKDFDFAMNAAPFAVLIVSQVIVFQGRVSFVGHLSGIVVGFACSIAVLQFPMDHPIFLACSVSYAALFSLHVLSGTQGSSIEGSGGVPTWQFVLCKIVSSLASLIEFGEKSEIHFSLSPTLFGSELSILAIGVAVMRGGGKSITRNHAMLYSASSACISLLFSMKTFDATRIRVLEPAVELLMLLWIFVRYYYNHRRTNTIANGVLTVV